MHLRRGVSEETGYSISILGHLYDRLRIGRSFCPPKIRSSAAFTTAELEGHSGLDTVTPVLPGQTFH